MMSVVGYSRNSAVMRKRKGMQELCKIIRRGPDVIVEKYLGVMQRGCCKVDKDRLWIKGTVEIKGLLDLTFFCMGSGF